MDQEPDKSKPIVDRRSRVVATAVALAVLVIMAAVAMPPRALLDKVDLVGYAICHRIRERSFIIAGRQLPLCARCSGTFLGANLGLGAMLLRRRHKAGGLPPITALAVLVGFVGLWGLDGLNSFLTFFPGAPHLYEPCNWLRLATGVLNGLALVTFVFPIWNFTLWREPTAQRVVKNLKELVVVLPFAALLVFLVQAEFDILLYPVAVLSSLGVLMMLTLINSMIVAVVMQREGYAQQWRQLLAPLVVGVALALLEVGAMAWLRIYLASNLGLSF